MKIVSQYDEAYEIDLEAKTWKLLANPQNVGNLRTTEGKFFHCSEPEVGASLSIIAESLTAGGSFRLIIIPTLKSVEA